jgi:hypothetical protein
MLRCMLGNRKNALCRCSALWRCRYAPRAPAATPWLAALPTNRPLVRAAAPQSLVSLVLQGVPHQSPAAGSPAPCCSRCAGSCCVHTGAGWALDTQYRSTRLLTLRRLMLHTCKSRVGLRCTNQEHQAPHQVAHIAKAHAAYVKGQGGLKTRNKGAPSYSQCAGSCSIRTAGGLA